MTGPKQSAAPSPNTSHKNAPAVETGRGDPGTKTPSDQTKRRTIRFVGKQLSRRSNTELDARKLRYRLELQSRKASKADQVESERARLDRLAATDMFVEKAQLVLTRRAGCMIALATFCLLVTIGTLLVAIYFGWEALNEKPKDGEVIATNNLILRIFLGLGLAGYFIIAMRTLIALTRSALHEATVLRDRRHAMRFGRLAVHYFQNDPLTLEELEQVFNWNIMSSSSFLDIDPNRVTETVVGNLTNMKQIADSFSETFKKS